MHATSFWPLMGRGMPELRPVVPRNLLSTEPVRFGLVNLTLDGGGHIYCSTDTINKTINNTDTIINNNQNKAINLTYTSISYTIYFVLHPSLRFQLLFCFIFLHNILPVLHFSPYVTHRYCFMHDSIFCLIHNLTFTHA